MLAASAAATALVPRIGAPAAAGRRRRQRRGLYWLSRMTEHGTYAGGLIGPILVTGAGVGLLIVPLPLVALARVAEADSGVASSLLNAITGVGTFLGGVLHTLPFLIPQYRPAVLVALAVIAFELLALAWIRRRFFGTGFLSSLVSVTLGGAVIATISAALGAVR